MIRAVIFDLDGTLVDAAEWHYTSLNQALLAVGWPMIDRAEHLATFDGLPTRQKLAILSQRGLPTSWHDTICKAKQRMTLDLIEEGCTPNPAHIDCLAKLRADGYKLGLASNAVRATVDLMLAKTNLGGHFNVTLSNEDVAAPKPAPDIYWASARLLGVHTSECLVAEDNQHGIKAAKAAGCKVYCVTSPSVVSYDAITRVIKFYKEAERCSTSSCPSPAVAPGSLRPAS